MQEEVQEQEAVQANELIEQNEQEKLLNAHQVQKIVQKEKALAAERARREAEAEFQQRMEALNQQRQQQAYTNENQSREIDAAAIAQQVREEINREMQQKQFEDEMNRAAGQYLNQVSSAREKYEDFDKVTANFDAQEHPKLVYMLSGLENAGDVVYHLMQNRGKLSDVLTLLEKAPKIAHEDLLELSQSIALNKKAQERAGEFETPEPLDRLNPSRVSGGNGEQSIRDLKAASWLRG